MSSKPYRYYFKLDDGVEGKAVGMVRNASTKTIQFIDVKITERDVVREHYYYVVPEEKVVALEEVKAEVKSEETAETAEEAKPKKRARKTE